MIKKLIIILICIIIVCFSIIINNYTKKYRISNTIMTMEMDNSNIYFYNDNKLVFNYYSKKTNIDQNWNKFESLDNKGFLKFNNKNYTFNANSIVLKNRKNVSFNDIIVDLNKNSKINIKSGKLDITNMNLVSNDKIFYKNKNVLGSSKGCFADLYKQNIQLYNTHLEF